MKMLILSLIMILGFSTQNYSKPINDIYSMEEPILEEEAYINDIPFNTWEVAVDAILEGDEIKLPEEPYINDIPFDTKAVATKCLLNKMIEMSGEINVNDIPFNTEKIWNEYLSAKITDQYRNEKNINDLPDGPNFIICSYEDGIPSCVAVKVKVPKNATARQRKIEKSDYTIIYPVNQELPNFELNNDARNMEILYITGFSL